MTIATETRTLIRASLDGDPTLALFTVASATPDTLTVDIAQGVPANSIGGTTYDPAPPFRRETLIELIVRVQRLLWQRVGATGILLPPNEKALRALRTKHDHAMVPFECWWGWTGVLDASFAWLQEVAPQNDWAPNQIKEKFGTLRFYWHGDVPQIGEEIIEAAEHISGHLCEICGAPGKLQIQQGWWTTRCPEHKHRRPQ